MAAVGLLVLALAMLTTVAAGSYAYSTKPITPDLTRLSPMAGLKRLFSKQQLVETAKLAANNPADFELKVRTLA